MGEGQAVTRYLVHNESAVTKVCTVQLLDALVHVFLRLDVYKGKPFERIVVPVPNQVRIFHLKKKRECGGSGGEEERCAEEKLRENRKSGKVS